MNWKQEAINDLRSYEIQKRSLNSIKERMEALEDNFKAIKCCQTDSVAVQGSGESHIEERMIDNIVERERLEHTYRATKMLVGIVERGLKELTDEERAVLNKFYINRPYRHVDILMDELHLEKTRIYQIKDKAIYKFTISMYGISEY